MANVARRLQGNVAIVTGGRRGIGRAIALALAEAGSCVAVCAATQDDKLYAVASDAMRFGQRALGIGADVTQKEDVDNAIRLVKSEFGKIDILVNCAGIVIPNLTILESTESDWDKVINTNLKGTYLFSQAAAREMVAQKRGVIINVTSDMGISPKPGLGAYCASKAGIVALTRQMALELAMYNIRVNAIAPGLTRTDMNYPMSSPELETKADACMVMGHVADPTDISKVALFLVSDDSGYITGETITVNGGGQIEPPITK